VEMNKHYDEMQKVIKDSKGLIEAEKQRMKEV